jgi:hypothetical protein
VAAWAGLQLVNHNSVVRICNITADMNYTLTDKVLNMGRTAFARRYGVLPDFCVMSHNSLLQLQNSRTTYNPVGAQAPIPTEDTAHVPIHATLGITDTEPIVVSGATLATAPAHHEVEVEGAGGVQRDPAGP